MLLCSPRLSEHLHSDPPNIPYAAFHICQDRFIFGASPVLELQSDGSNLDLILYMKQPQFKYKWIL